MRPLHKLVAVSLVALFIVHAPPRSTPPPTLTPSKTVGVPDWQKWHGLRRALDERAYLFAWLEAEAAKPKPANKASVTAAVSVGSDVWAALAMCESGGNPATNTGNGFYGAFQFTYSTWVSVGESGLPSDAPYSVQLAAAQRLQARSGWGQWPACAKKLGLL